jgi:hypothetical protein
MAHMVGADPVQLDALGARMTSAAERLESIRTSIGALLAHSHWDGRDADEFRHLWHHQLAPRLHNAAIVTRAGATTVRANAQQQCDASGVASIGASTRAPASPRACGEAAERDVLDDVLRAVGFGMLGDGVAHLVRAVSRTADKLWRHPLERLFSSGEKAVEHAIDGMRGGRILKIIEKRLPVVGLLNDGAIFLREFAKDPTSAGTFNAGVATLLSAGGLVPGPVGIVATGLGVVHGFASLDGSQQHEEWLRGATIKFVTGSVVAPMPLVHLAVQQVPTETFVQQAKAGERAIDAVLRIKNDGLNGVPEYCK